MLKGILHPQKAANTFRIIMRNGYIGRVSDIRSPVSISGCSIISLSASCLSAFPAHCPLQFISGIHNFSTGFEH